METMKYRGDTYTICRTQAEIDAIAGPDAMIAVDFPANADARITQARSVRVLQCRSLDASDAKIGGNLNAYDAKISGNLSASGAKIGGDLDADDATIGGSLYASDAKINGIEIAEPTSNQRELLTQIAARLDRLDMSSWHGSGWNPNAEGDCGTTHCLAGWAQAISDDPKIRRMEPYEAGKKLLPCCVHLFFAPKSVVKKYLAAYA